MFELGFGTDFKGQSTKLSEIENTLKKIAEAGFSHVHWCHEWDGDYLYSKSEMQQIASWFEKYHLKAKSLHASKGSRIFSAMRKDYESRKDFTSNNEFNRQAGVELIQNRIDLAYTLKATEIVLHLYIPYLNFEENQNAEEIFIKQLYQSLDEIEVYAKNKNIRICFETMLDTPYDIQEKYFDLLFKRYPKEYLGMCLDTGHAYAILNEKMYDWIEKYIDHIFNVHINDNLGGPSVDIYGREALVWQCDLHWIPFEGRINWERVCQILAKSPYELPLVLELSCYEQDIDLFLKRSFEAGQTLTGMIEELRNGNTQI